MHNNAIIKTALTKYVINIWCLIGKYERKKPNVCIFLIFHLHKYPLDWSPSVPQCLYNMKFEKLGLRE